MLSDSSESATQLWKQVPHKQVGYAKVHKKIDENPCSCPAQGPHSAATPSASLEPLAVQRLQHLLQHLPPTHLLQPHHLWTPLPCLQCLPVCKLGSSLCLDVP